MIDIESAVTALKNERDGLVEQLAHLGATETGELTGDVDFGEGFADAAAATAERSEVLGIIENLRDLVGEVDAALEKADAGTYGRCESCGKDIGTARMDFRPTSRYCVGCKTKRS